MDDNIIIRKADITDAPFVYEMVCSLENEKFDKAIFDNCYKLCLNEKNHHYLIAIYNNDIIGDISCHGQVLLHHLGLVYEIQELYVKPDYRNCGWAKRSYTK